MARCVFGHGVSFPGAGIATEAKVDPFTPVEAETVASASFLMLL